MKLDKVLLCTDFSEPANQLTECLLELKDKGLKEVVLIHVVNIRSAGGNASVLQKFNQEQLTKVAEEIEEDGFSVKVSVPIGFPPHEIVDAALKEQVSLILLGAIGKGVVRRVFLGSTAFDVIRISKVPVLVEKFTDTKREECEIICRRKFERVVVPVDFSDDSLSVVENMGNLLQGRGRMVLVFALEGSENKKDLKKAKEDAEKKLEDLKSEWENTGAEVKCHVKEGIASQSILQVAEEKEATLIAMSKRGRGQIRELLIGSTAEAVALRSKIPILLFPSKTHR